MTDIKSKGTPNDDNIFSKLSSTFNSNKKRFSLFLIAVAVLNGFIIYNKLLPENAVEHRHGPYNIRSVSTSRSQNKHKYVCTQECMAIKQEIQRWPKNKPKALIYMLINNNSIYGEERLQDSLPLLDKNFNNYYKYPIVVFHESDIGLKEKKTIQTLTKSKLFFYFLNFTIPWYLKDNISPSTILCHPRRIGYRHMCQFNAIDVYRIPFIPMLDYVWRFDDDSMINQNVTYDIFQFMKDRKLLYGYTLLQSELDRCVPGLLEFALDFYNNITQTITPKMIKELNKYGLVLKPPSYCENKRYFIYYNNFEIAHRSVFLNPVYVAFSEALDENRGVYTRRWGDAPIKTLAVNMMIPNDKIYMFCDVDYFHHNRKTIFCPRQAGNMTT